MKYLLVLVVVLIAIGIWRSKREGRAPPAARKGPGPSADGKRAIEMVSCAVCGVHCPRTDALAGKRGLYCSAQHRGQAEP